MHLNKITETSVLHITNNYMFSRDKEELSDSPVPLSAVST